MGGMSLQGTDSAVAELPLAQPVAPIPAPPAAVETARLRDLSSQQWKSGAAAWLGWMFDGLDMHLYTMVATPFVAELLDKDQSDPAVGFYGSWIQAAFLIGWALGGAFFGRIGDKLGRSRALVLTILTYAAFTGLSYFAQSWQQLFVCRFLAALGIGGEWAVGAALLSETWPRAWGPWIAAVLQSAVNIGVMVASVAVYCLAAFPPRCVFLVGVIPAILVVWIRRAVPEPEEWHAARRESRHVAPSVAELFRGPVRRTTLLTMLVCALGLTAHWALMFWYAQHLRHLPDVASWTAAEKSRLVSQAMTVLMVSSILGNFTAAAIARRIGYRLAIVLMLVGYFAAMLGAFSVERSHVSTCSWLAVIGVCQGVFALFTMYLPPLFPTLLRTTGAGLCYNIGRIAAAIGTVCFGLSAPLGNYRLSLLYAGLLFLPAAGVAMFLPEAASESVPSPTE
jgi:MFS family permease